MHELIEQNGLFTKCKDSLRENLLPYLSQQDKLALRLSCRFFNKLIPLDLVTLDHPLPPLHCYSNLKIPVSIRCLLIATNTETIARFTNKLFYKYQENLYSHEDQFKTKGIKEPPKFICQFKTHSNIEISMTPIESDYQFLTMQGYLNDLIIVICDISDAETFRKIKFNISEINSYYYEKPKPTFYLILNNSKPEAKPAVSYEDIQALKRKYNCGWYNLNINNAESVKDAFKNCIRHYLLRHFPNEGLRKTQNKKENRCVIV